VDAEIVFRTEPNGFLARNSLRHFCRGRPSHTSHCKVLGWFQTFQNKNRTEHPVLRGWRGTIRKENLRRCIVRRILYRLAIVSQQEAAQRSDTGRTKTLSRCSHAPGRTSCNRARAPAASIIALEPRGRCSWRYGNLLLSSARLFSLLFSADSAKDRSVANLRRLAIFLQPLGHFTTDR
jgi:hypothetical protein